MLLYAVLRIRNMRRNKRTVVRCMLMFAASSMLMFMYSHTGTINPSEVNANYENKDDRQKERETQSAQSDSAMGINRGPTVMVLASHRTGSSVVASVFQAFPKSFFIFEPLHGILHRTTYLNGTTVTVTKSNREEIYREEAHKMLTCSFENIPVYTIMFVHRTSFKDSLYQLYNCILTEINDLMAKQQFNISQELDVVKKGYIFFDSEECTNVGFCISPDDLRNMRTKCLTMSDITEKCKQAPLRAFKFIRLSMELAGTFLQKIPSLKIIHLLRDPRANFISQKRVIKPDANIDTIMNLASWYCQVVWWDSKFKQEIIKTYPNSIYTLQFEAFADDPITMTEKLYSFIGLPFHDIVEKTVWYNTLSGEKTECVFCVHRGNSSATARRWRFLISKNEYLLVNSYCSDIIGRMGLTMPKYEELKNM